MRKKQNLWIIICVVFAIALAGCGSKEADTSDTVAESLENARNKADVVAEQPVITEKSNTINILFTSDTHSHFESFTENSSEIGGFARMKTLADSLGAGNADTIFVDCGDFSTGVSVTGAPYSKLFASDAAEIRMLKRTGVEYTTFGNHELDFGEKGLLSMTKAVIASGEEVPKLLCCNVDFKSVEQNTPALEKSFEYIGFKSYDIIEKTGIKIAIIGVLGQDAIDWSEEFHHLEFRDPVESVRSTVDEIKEAGGADLYLLLAHGGTNRATLGIVNSNEIKKIIDNTPELNVVICGHTHSTFEEPVIYNDTVMAACGCFTRNLGQLILENVSADEPKWEVNTYKLHPVTADIEEDKDILEYIAEMRAKL